MGGPPACGFCKRAIGEEFHFVCLACGRAYCYIHMSRHAHARRQVAPLTVGRG